MNRYLLLSAVCVSLFSGCAVHQLQDDQDKMRNALLALYTNQVMDNLVRAINGYPIIQLDYANANSILTIDANATAGDGLGTSRTPARGAARSNVVGVSASPMTTDDAPYDAYLRFLAEPGSLRITKEPPRPGTACMCVRYQKEYYWVPAEFKELFSKLATIVTAQRGEVLCAPDDFYQVNIVDFAPQPTSQQMFEYMKNRFTQESDARKLSALEKLRSTLPKSLDDVKLDDFMQKLDGCIPGEWDVMVQFAGGQRKDRSWIVPVTINQWIVSDGGTVQFPGTPDSDERHRVRLEPYYPSANDRIYKTNMITLTLAEPTTPAKWRSPDDFHFPMAARLRLDRHPNKQQPTTKQLLERIPFRTPQASMEIHGMTPPPCARLPAEMVGRKESPFTQSEAEAEADPFQPSEERAAEPRFLPELPTGLGAGFADRWTPNTAPLATFGPARPNP